MWNKVKEMQEQMGWQQDVAQAYVYHNFYERNNLDEIAEDIVQLLANGRINNAYSAIFDYNLTPDEREYVLHRVDELY